MDMDRQSSQGSKQLMQLMPEGHALAIYCAQALFSRQRYLGFRPSSMIKPEIARRIKI